MNRTEFNFPQNTTFLITGGAGFIGSNLAEKILDLGYKVVVFDNFLTGKKENIKDFINHYNFKLIEGDICNINECIKACKNIDYVLHQAALGSVLRSTIDPRNTNDVNITGTLNMLIAARDCKVKRFIYASSSSVYGDEPNLPKREDRIGKPLSPYAVTKIACELYAINFFDLYKLPTIGLRYFNVFGKNQSPNSIYAAVIPTFVKKLLNKESPTINGDGNQSRDFTYIENVIQANLKACLANKKCFGEVFNIANGGRVSINMLYQKICEILNVDIRPIYAVERLGDIKHSNADISKAEKMLEYFPKLNFDDGLKLSIDWYKKHIGECRK